MIKLIKSNTRGGRGLSSRVAGRRWRDRFLGHRSNGGCSREKGDGAGSWECQPLRAFLEKGTGYYPESMEPASLCAGTERRHPWSTCVSPHSGEDFQSRGSEATVPGWGQAWLSLSACIFSALSPECSALSSEVQQREPEEKPSLGEWDKPHSQHVPFQGLCPSCPSPSSLLCS